ncbi:MAG: type 1 glutamine amidotransferase domain-containing protein, partial [Pseudomonadales bacterium]|nr:type 1 glutamine amidotransferase domain-containing protein [Pseudomonadales bacterium]
SDGEFLIAGKKVTGFTNSEEAKVGLTEKVPFLLEDRLVSLGGRFQASADFSDNVVVDHRVVTGQNPQSAESVGKALVELLKK